MKNIPWVEKYRPNNFNDIVLDKYNKIILENIVSKSYFPNLLFYGPPGTGKTTTILCLIKEYQKKHNCKNINCLVSTLTLKTKKVPLLTTQRPIITSFNLYHQRH